MIVSKTFKIHRQTESKIKLLCAIHNMKQGAVLDAGVELLSNKLNRLPTGYPAYPAHIERLQEERTELSIKICKLEAFLNEEDGRHIRVTKEEWRLMHAQKLAMESYRDMLDLRYMIGEAKNGTNT